MSRFGVMLGLALGVCFVFNSSGIAQIPFGYQHLSTRGQPSHVLYDSFHQRFYGAVPDEGAVYVIDEATGGVVQKISVPSAYGLDLSVDGTRLYVSSNVTILGHASAQMIFEIDTSTLHVVNIIRPTVNYTGLGTSPLYNNVPQFLAALSNGKLAYTATSIGATGGSVFLYDPFTTLSSWINPPSYYAGNLYKSSNGDGFVIASEDTAGEAVAVFDTASGTYSANTYFSSTNNGDIVMSPDGTMVLLGGHILCNRSLQEIGDLAVQGQPTTLAWTSQGSSFSPDGSKIYVASSLNTTVTLQGGGTSSYSNPVIYVYSSSSHQLLATAPLPEGSLSFRTGYNGLAVGNTGKAMLIDNAGFLILDPSKAPATLPGAYYQAWNNASPDAGSATSPGSMTLNGAGYRAGAASWFGKSPASTTYVSQNVLNVQPPPGKPGLVDVTISFPDGWAILAPNAYSYGPVITKQTANAGSTEGGTTVTLYGNGFDATSGSPTVTVGGATATVTSARYNTVNFTTPPGTVGPADIQLTSDFGTTTVRGGFIYMTQKLIPSLLPNQMIVDNARNLIYVADANTGNVYSVNAATLASSVLLTPPSGRVTALAISPDGSELLAANASACTLDIIDLTTGKDMKTIVPTPGNQTGTFYPTDFVVTARGTALVSIANAQLLDNGELVEVNLTTGATTIVLGFTVANTLLTSSADGSLVYIAQSSRGGSSGNFAPMLWSAASDSIIKSGNAGELGSDDLSTTDIGDRVMGECYTSDQVDTWLRFATVCEPDSQLVSGRYPVYGSTIHSSGSLGYIPTTKGVEIFDIHHGQTILTIGNAAGSLAGLDNLAVSHDGSRLYVAQPNGIAVFALPSVPLSIGSITPSNGDASGGQSVVLRGSGFVNGVTVTVDGNPATVQFVDSTKLFLTMPAVTPAEDVVTVTNPDSTSYTLDAAWNAAHITSSIPTLTSLTPSQAYTGEALPLTVNGTGFVPDSVVYLNGIAAETQFISTTELTTQMTDLPGPGTQLITVQNPSNTQISNSLPLTVSDASPVLNTITPSSLPAGSQAFELTAFGNTVLAPNSVVQWNGYALQSQLIDSSHIVAQVAASLVASPGTASITIYSAGANPTTSPAETFTITPSVASVTINKSSIVLGPVLAGGRATTTFAITSTGAIPLVITTITSSDSNFTVSGCTSALSQGQSCTATVSYTPVNNSGLQGESGQLTINSNASSQPSLYVQGFSGSVVFYPGTTQLSVTAGQSTTDTFNVVSYGYIPAFTAQFACTGAPATSTCTVSPDSFSVPEIDGNGNGSANFTVNITTQAPTSGSLRRFPSLPETTALAILLFLFRSQRGKHTAWLAGVFLLFLLTGMTACGSGGNIGGGGGGGSKGGTPPGTYTLTVTATIPGAAPVTQTLSLKVN
ncbi:MAG TPA: IPT/TIG domain-containing protein [Terracidiphilus sp.]|jgi:hypothetical protein